MFQWLLCRSMWWWRQSRIPSARSVLPWSLAHWLMWWALDLPRLDGQLFVDCCVFDGREVAERGVHPAGVVEVDVAEEPHASVGQGGGLTGRIDVLVLQ